MQRSRHGDVTGPVCMSHVSAARGASGWGFTPGGPLPQTVSNPLDTPNERSLADCGNSVSSDVDQKYRPLPHYAQIDRQQRHWLSVSPQSGDPGLSRHLRVHADALPGQPGQGLGVAVDHVPAYFSADQPCAFIAQGIRSAVPGYPRRPASIPTPAQHSIVLGRPAGRRGCPDRLRANGHVCTLMVPVLNRAVSFAMFAARISSTVVP